MESQLQVDGIDTLNTNDFPCWGCYMDENDGEYTHSGQILFSHISKTDSQIQIEGYKYITNKTREPINVSLSNNATIRLFQDPYNFNTILQDIRSWSNGFYNNETMNVSGLKTKLSLKPEERQHAFFDSILPCWACYKQKEIYSGLFVLADIRINGANEVEIIGFNYTAKGEYGLRTKDGKLRLALIDHDEIRIFKDASEFAETLEELKEELKGLTSAAASLRL